MKIIRQGDVLLVEVEKLPAGEVKRHTQLTLAYGEATGHHHTLYQDNAAAPGEVLPDAPVASAVHEVVVEGRRFIEIDTDWLLKHQEHECLKINPGVYEIIIEREYDVFEETKKKVVD